MSLLKRQKRASSTHHGHQRDKTKWNPTDAARRHPSPRDYLHLPLPPPRLLSPLSTLLSWPRLPVCAIFFPPPSPPLPLSLSLFPPFISLPPPSSSFSSATQHGFDPVSSTRPPSSILEREGKQHRERERGGGGRRTHANPFFYTEERRREQPPHTYCFILCRNFWANRSPSPLAVLNAIFKNAEVE